MQRNVFHPIWEAKPHPSFLPSPPQGGDGACCLQSPALTYGQGAVPPPPIRTLYAVSRVLSRALPVPFALFRSKAARRGWPPTLWIAGRPHPDHPGHRNMCANQMLGARFAPLRLWGTPLGTQSERIGALPVVVNPRFFFMREATRRAKHSATAEVGDAGIEVGIDMETCGQCIPQMPHLARV